MCWWCSPALSCSPPILMLLQPTRPWCRPWTCPRCPAPQRALACPPPLRWASARAQRRQRRRAVKLQPAGAAAPPSCAARSSGTSSAAHAASVQSEGHEAGGWAWHTAGASLAMRTDEGGAGERQGPPGPALVQTSLKTATKPTNCDTSTSRRVLQIERRTKCEQTRRKEEGAAAARRRPRYGSRAAAL